MRYSKSPVSEVIFGITFVMKSLDLGDILIAYKELAANYPSIEVVPPLADETLVDFRSSTELDADKTGPFLLRLRTPDRKWLVQLQGNKVYLNWIRLDVEDVGHYAGFKAIRKRLNDVVSILGSAGRSNFDSEVKYLELTYHDRIEWQPLVPSISNSSEIMRFQPPDIGIPKGFNNIFSKYTYHEERIGGFGVLSINTATSVKGTQLLKFENTLRGTLADRSRDDWYEIAHNIQFEQFERLFTDSLLKEWQ